MHFRAAFLSSSFVLLGLGMIGCGPNYDVTFGSLLDEMVDRDRMAMFPSPEYRLEQHSSYHRNSVTPEDPEGWFANRDRGHFIRTEENDGRTEWVLMEHRGPGAIARTWMPDPRITPMVLRGRREAPDSLGTLRVYLDGNPDPVIEGPTYDLFNGTTITAYPFGHKSLSSAVSFLPFPWAESVKITMDVAPRFFIFTYRTYEAGTEVKTFSMEDLEDEKALMDAVGARLVSPAASQEGLQESVAGRIPPGEQTSLDLPTGEHAVRILSIKLGDYGNPQVTRSVVVQMTFDGEETVWSPVGDFFGTGVGLHPFQGWYRTVSEDGRMTCRWIMPYRESASVTVLNLHDESVDVELEATVGDWHWNERSMYFHTTWNHESDMPTRPPSDWNYVTLDGQGVYVGDALTVWNPEEIWWGEGDAKIWVDGEDFPSIFGTGTEDYYAYAYGGQNRAFYEHPFHAQVRVMEFDTAAAQRREFRRVLPIRDRPAHHRVRSEA